MEHQHIHHPYNLHLLHLTMYQILFGDVGWQNMQHMMSKTQHILLLLLTLLDRIQSFIIKQDVWCHHVIAILASNVCMMMEIGMEDQEVLEWLQTLYPLQFLLKLLLLLQ